MKKLATALVALSVLAVATPSLAKHHEEAKAEVKAEAAKTEAAAPAKKHKHKKAMKAQQQEVRGSRHVYPGSTGGYANRHENGVAAGAAVVKH